jgi:hypothetical protein
MDYELSDREMHSLLTHLTSLLLGLEMLRERTPLSPRQAVVVEHALHAARGMRQTLLERIVAEHPARNGYRPATVQQPWSTRSRGHGGSPRPREA